MVQRLAHMLLLVSTLKLYQTVESFTCQKPSNILFMIDGIDANVVSKESYRFRNILESTYHALCNQHNEGKCGIVNVGGQNTTIQQPATEANLLSNKSDSKYIIKPLVLRTPIDICSKIVNFSYLFFQNSKIDNYVIAFIDSSEPTDHCLNTVEKLKSRNIKLILLTDHRRSGEGFINLVLKCSKSTDCSSLVDLSQEDLPNNAWAEKICSKIDVSFENCSKLDEFSPCYCGVDGGANFRERRYKLPIERYANISIAGSPNLENCAESGKTRAFSQVESCNEKCIPKCNEWMEFGACIGKCSHGYMERSRKPTYTTDNKWRDDCLPLVDRMPCKVARCPVGELLGEWSSWSSCTTCGEEDVTVRKRVIIRQAEYQDTTTETEQPVLEDRARCVEKDPKCMPRDPCGDWEEWSTPENYCGDITITRRRNALTRTDKCPLWSETKEEKTIKTGIRCEEDGYCGIFLPWEACSLTCGVGVQKRSRSHWDDPPAKINGRSCSQQGLTKTEYRDCLSNKCKGESEVKRCIEECNDLTKVNLLTEPTVAIMDEFGQKCELYCSDSRKTVDEVLGTDFIMSTNKKVADIQPSTDMTNKPDIEGLSMMQEDSKIVKYQEKFFVAGLLGGWKRKLFYLGLVIFILLLWGCVELYDKWKHGDSGDDSSDSSRPSDEVRYHKFDSSDEKPDSDSKIYP